LATFTPVIPIVPSLDPNPTFLKSDNSNVSFFNSNVSFFNGRRPTPCKKFNSPTGCLYGKNCKFTHVKESADNIKKPCLKFNSPTGCLFGKNCRFSHDSTKVIQNNSVFQLLQIPQEKEKEISSLKIKKVVSSKEVKKTIPQANLFSNLDNDSGDDSNDDDDDDN
jgi:hypothetical protein